MKITITDPIYHPYGNFWSMSAYREDECYGCKLEKKPTLKERNKAREILLAKFKLNT